eukprot:6364262-Pyramimonas_sp.AAC.1
MSPLPSAFTAPLTSTLTRLASTLVSLSVHLGFAERRPWFRLSSTFVLLPSTFVRLAAVSRGPQHCGAAGGAGGPRR